MKIQTIILTATTTIATILVSCDSKGKQLPVETKQDSITVVETPMATPQPVLSDTVGLYKITNAEAREYIVKMHTILGDVEKAMTNNNLAAMPGLMGDLTNNQRKQNEMRAMLSETEATLFNGFMKKIADKMDNISDRMSKM